MRRQPWDRDRYTWQIGDYPLTKVIIALNALTFLAGLLRLPIMEWLAFYAPSSLARPWTILTYPLISSDIFGLLFYGLWLYFVGSSLERSWGTRFYGLYFAAMAAITASGMSLGAALLLHGSAFPIQPTMPLAALTVAFCMLNPDLEIRLWGIIPILAKWLAVGEVLILFFVHFSIHPLMGFFALSGCAASFLWVRTRAWGGVQLYSTMPVAPRRPKSRAKLRIVPPDDRSAPSNLNPLEWLARRRRKKQFERLMKDD